MVANYSFHWHIDTEKEEKRKEKGQVRQQSKSDPICPAKASIAVVILTHNEEENLPACLASVQWADEILIVDSGSQDQTKAIARSHNIRTLTRRITPFLISEQRNFALQQGGITAEWILFVDADEIITEALRHELQQTLASVSLETIAYRLAPKFIFLGRWLRHCGGYPVWHDRLLRNGELRFRGGVWESFDLTTQSNITIGHIKEPYIHNSLNKGIDDWLAKHSRYATAEARDILTTLGEQIDEGKMHVRTTRKRGLRTIAAYLWPLRPILRFCIMYFWQRGFLDGLPGLLYSLMIVCYEFLIVLKVIEFRRRQQKLPL